MTKNSQIHIRLSTSELELLKRIANKFNMSLTDFILSVLIPYCVKLDK